MLVFAVLQIVGCRFGGGGGSDGVQPVVSDSFEGPPQTYNPIVTNSPHATEQLKNFYETLNQANGPDFEVYQTAVSSVAVSLATESSKLLQPADPGRKILFYDSLNAPPELASLTVGSIILGPPNESFPDGIVRKVVDRVEEGGQVRLETAVPQFTEIFEYANIGLRKGFTEQNSAIRLTEEIGEEDELIIDGEPVPFQLKVLPQPQAIDYGPLGRVETPESLRNRAMENLIGRFAGLPNPSPGIRMARGEKGFYLRQELVIYDKDKEFKTTGDQIRIILETTIDVGFEFALHVEFMKVKELLIGFLAQAQADVTLMAAVKKSFEWKKKMFEISGPPMVIPAGPVPLPARVNVPVYLVFKGEIGFDGSVIAQMKWNYKAGGHWKDEKQQPYATSTFKFDMILPFKDVEAIDFNGNLRFMVAPEAGVTIGKFFSPRIFPSIFVQAFFTPMQKVLFEVFAGIDCYWGGEFEIPFIKKVDFKSYIFDIKKTIKSWPNPLWTKAGGLQASGATDLTDQTIDTISTDSFDYKYIDLKEFMGLELVVVTAPSGSIGSLKHPDTQPVFNVLFRNLLFVGKTEVTQRQYRLIMGENPSLFANWTGLKADNLPVEQVTWLEAVEFCNRLSKLKRMDECYTVSNGEVVLNPSAEGFRLPTEAEWEHFCRGGTKTDYYWGDQIDNKYAWNWNNPSVSWQSNLRHPCEVGTREPNSSGLYDLSGNVAEWCWDWYGPYSQGAKENPTGPATGSHKIIRGGGWDQISAQNESLSSFARRKGGIKGRYNWVGFRVVRRNK